MPKTRRAPKKSAARRSASERLSWLAPATIVGLVLSVGVRIAQQTIGVLFRSIGRGDVLTDAELALSARLFSISDTVETIAYVVLAMTAVLFLAWVGTAHRAVGPRAATGTSPGLPKVGYAVGVYFIPFLNLLVPAQHMRTLIDALQTRHVEPPPMTEATYRATARRASAGDAPPRWDRRLVALWWGSWLLGMALLLVSMFMSKALHLPGTTPRVMGFACITLSFAFAVPLVWMVTQRIRAARGARSKATASASVASCGASAAS